MSLDSAIYDAKQNNISDEIIICFCPMLKSQKYTTNLEDTNSLEHLFDIDVIGTDRIKLSQDVYKLVYP